MGKQFSNLLILAGAMMLLFVGGSVLAQGNQVASESVDSSGIAFQMNVNDATELTVAGKGVYLQMAFNAGETPHFTTVDEEGVPFPDGSYKYELRTQPEIDTKALEEAEQMGDDRRMEEISRAEQEQMMVQNGSFEIVYGAIIPHEHGQAPDANRD